MTETCRHEVHVRRAAVEDRWSEALREHIETCVDCRAAAAVAPIMSSIARFDERQHVLPSPSVIWLKAQLLRSTATLDRISRPLNIMQMIAYVAVAAGWAGMLMWKWSDIQRMIFSFTPTHVAEGISGSATVSMSLLFAIVVLGSTTFVLAMHTILAED